MFVAEILKTGRDKLAQPHDSPTQVVGFNLSDLVEAGRQRIDDCHATIQRMLTEAEQEAQTIREVARQEGYSEGLGQAEATVAERISEQAELRSRQRLDRLQESIERLYQTHEDWMTDYAEILSDLAISIAERVIRKEVSDSPELILQWISEALRNTRLSRAVTLSLHPDALSDIGELLDKMLVNEGIPESVKVVQDPKLGRYDVKITQTGGEIHAGMLAQLAQLGVTLKR